MKTTLQEVTRFARMHILGGCILCAGKGFICEVCKDKEPLYPFDLDSIVQCEKCFAVFHPECSFELKNCTKCDRIEARNIKWHVFLSQNDRELSPVNGEQNSIEIPSNWYLYYIFLSASMNLFDNEIDRNSYAFYWQ